MAKNDEISEPPGLEDISNLFPPSAPASSSLVGTGSMKLPVFWPDAVEVWFTQAETQFVIQNVSVSSPASRSSISDLGFHPLSSSL